MNLNRAAAALVDAMIADGDRLRIAAQTLPCGTTVVDCGIRAPGGLEAGRRLAEICMAGLGRVEIAPTQLAGIALPGVVVRTDHPVAACMGAQYAGWQLTLGKYFAMGSGPMRAAARKEGLIESLELGEDADIAVGVLESGKLPPNDLCRDVADDCRVPPAKLRLLVARTASLAGGVQIVARSVETALHKLHELGFDLSRIESGYGVAPLPPPAGDDFGSMGRTNDAILYAGEVTLFARGDDETLAETVARVPSCASRDHGLPFAEIFARGNGDFYAIDPLLFAPAVVALVNLDTGRVFRAGRFEPQIVLRSFGIE